MRHFNFIHVSQLNLTDDRLGIIYLRMGIPSLRWRTRSLFKTKLLQKTIATTITGKLSVKLLASMQSDIFHVNNKVAKQAFDPASAFRNELRSFVKL